MIKKIIRFIIYLFCKYDPDDEIKKNNYNRIIDKLI